MIHKKSIILLMGLLLLLSTLTGCKKVDPFSGEDNFFLSFQLAAPDGEAYKGSLQGDEITVRIPSNVARTSLTAKYNLSDLASVSPKPEEVKGWMESQTFTVTSYSGATRTYTVKVQSADVALNSAIHLTTDEEVAQFLTQGVDIINGNLILGAENAEDSIHSLEGLAKLKEVRYKLILHSNVVADLSPLKGLERIGSLQFMGNNDSIKVIDLPNVKSIPNGFQINCDSLKSISMPMLEEMGTVSIEAENLTDFQIPSVKGLFGNVSIKASQLKALDFPELMVAQNIHLNKSSYSKPLELTSFSMPKLETVESIKLEEAKALEAFSLPALKKADKIDISMLKSLTTFDLSSLKEVEEIKFTSDWRGDMSNKLIKELAFPKLERVKTIQFERDPFKALESLIFPELTEVDKLYIPDNLTKYEAPKLEKVNTLLYVSGYLPSVFDHIKSIPRLEIDLTDDENRVVDLIDLSHVQSIENVTISPYTIGKIIFPETISGDVVISYNGRPVTKAPIMEGLKECQSFMLELAHDMEEVELPATLEKISKGLKLTSNFKKVTAKGLKEIGENLDLGGAATEYLDMPALEKVGGDLDLQTKYFKDANLPKLTEVGAIKFGGRGNWEQNESLVNLNFLSHLQKLKKVEIAYCTVLMDYSGLKQLVENGQINESNWTSSKVNNNLYNPTYQDLKAGRYKLQ